MVGVQVCWGDDDLHSKKFWPHLCCTACEIYGNFHVFLQNLTVLKTLVLLLLQERDISTLAADLLAKVRSIGY